MPDNKNSALGTYLLLAAEKDLDKNCEDYHHNRYNDANCEIWLFLSLLNKILQEKLKSQYNITCKLHWDNNEKL